MTLTLENFNGMELVWGKLPKTPDGSRAVLSLDDIDEMWFCGIVNTAVFSLAEWRAAFDEHKRDKTGYTLTKEELLAKEKYRYKGEIMIPFDAMRINEGEYTDEGLKELFDLSVAPSCSRSRFELNKFIEGLKNDFRSDNDLIIIDSRAKQRIKDLLESHPSPLRRLELIFDRLLRSEISGIAAGEITPKQLAEIQISSFSTKPASETEAKWKALGAIEKKNQKTVVASKSEIPLKKIKRSRKGVRG